MFKEARNYGTKNRKLRRLSRGGTTGVSEKRGGHPQKSLYTEPRAGDA